jgi:RNA polymerase sigma-70 factor (ECF subfamily)
MSESEEQFFERLCIEVMEKLYSKAIRLVGSTERAENLVQQTYAAAFNVFEKYDKNSDFNKWLHEILVCINISPCLFVQEHDDN